MTICRLTVTGNSDMQDIRCEKELKKYTLAEAPSAAPTQVLGASPIGTFYLGTFYLLP